MLISPDRLDQPGFKDNGKLLGASRLALTLTRSTRQAY